MHGPRKNGHELERASLPSFFYDEARKFVEAYGHVMGDGLAIVGKMPVIPRADTPGVDPAAVFTEQNIRGVYGDVDKAGNYRLARCLSAVTLALDARNFGEEPAIWKVHMATSRLDPRNPRGLDEVSRECFFPHSFDVLASPDRTVAVFSPMIGERRRVDFVLPYIGLFVNSLTHDVYAESRLKVLGGYAVPINPNGVSQIIDDLGMAVPVSEKISLSRAGFADADGLRRIDLCQTDEIPRALELVVDQGILDAQMRMASLQVGKA